MTKARITVFHDEQKLGDVLYDGPFKEETGRIVYHDKTGGYNEVNIQTQNTIRIRRATEGFKSEIILSKEESVAHIKTAEGAFDIPINLLQLDCSEERVFACYDTGEKIAIQIDLVKE